MRLRGRSKKREKRGPRKERRLSERQDLGEARGERGWLVQQGRVSVGGKKGHLVFRSSRKGSETWGCHGEA